MLGMTTISGVPLSALPSENQVLAADTVAFTLTGNATGLFLNRKINATPQSYTLVGNTVSFSVTRKLSCTSQSYTLTTNDAVLSYGLTFYVDSAAFALTGIPVAFKREIPGIGTAVLPSIQTSAAGSFKNPTLPTKATAVLPSITMRGVGSSTPPPPPEFSQTVIAEGQNLKILRQSYGWGSVDLTLPTNWDKCASAICDPTKVRKVFSIYDVDYTGTNLYWSSCPPDCINPADTATTVIQTEPAAAPKVIHDQAQIEALKEERANVDTPKPILEVVRPKARLSPLSLKKIPTEAKKGCIVRVIDSNTPKEAPKKAIPIINKPINIKLTPNCKPITTSEIPSTMSHIAHNKPKNFQVGMYTKGRR